MGGGGKGGSDTSTTKVELDPRLETGSAEAIAAALRTAALPYQPNRGLQVAGLAPQEEAAFQGANQAAQAFGMPNVAGSDQGGYLPGTETVAGFQGYSTGGVYDNALDRSTMPSYRRMREALRASYVNSANKVSPNAAFTRQAAKVNPYVDQVSSSTSSQRSPYNFADQYDRSTYQANQDFLNRHAP